ncbi:MAG: PH domain-containing protein, partial [Nanoarchaeota archaeon]
DVKISSQGAGQEITFKNMANGKKLEENLDKLINSKQSIARKESKTTAQAKKEVKTPKLQRKTSYTNQFQMDMTRTLFPVFILMVVLFPLIIIWAIMLIPLIIKVSATKYFVKKSSMEESYEFLSAKSKEFTNEKITAVIVRENILDKLFNTMTIDFWSIGSSEHISFQNIKKSPGIVDAVTAKTGIIKQDMLQEMNSAFSIQKMIFAVLPLNFIIFSIIVAGFVLSILHPLFLAIPILTIMVLLIIIVYNTEYYKRSRLTFYKDYLHFKRGLLFKDNFFVLYNNIKDIKTKKHPVSGAGSIKFNIAGVHMQGNGNQKALVSNSFKINYIDDIAVKDDLIDYTLYNRPDKSTLLQAKKNIQSIRAQTIHHTKPALINPLFILLVFSVIIFPLILLLPLTLPLLVLHIRAKSYIIEDYRALARAGIVYKTQTSIVFSKIDHLNTTQNFLNKMFKNGNVIINTAGSQMPELVISNIPDYRNFYEILNRYY